MKGVGRGWPKGKARKPFTMERKQSRSINLINKQFGRLTVISYSESNNGHAKWLCKCICGNEKIINSHALISGNTNSCGCFQHEINIKPKTLEIKQKISIKLMGRNDHIKKGSDCFLWKGGATPVNKAERMSLNNTKWRRNVFERDNYICKKCGDKGKIQAHHIKSFADNKLNRYDLDNGIVLCKKCHSDFHKKYGYFLNDYTDQTILFLQKTG